MSNTYEGGHQWQDQNILRDIVQTSLELIAILLYEVSHHFYLVLNWKSHSRSSSASAGTAGAKEVRWRMSRKTSYSSLGPSICYLLMGGKSNTEGTRQCATRITSSLEGSRVSSFSKGSGGEVKLLADLALVDGSTDFYKCHLTSYKSIVLIARGGHKKAWLIVGGTSRARMWQEFLGASDSLAWVGEMASFAWGRW